MIKGKSFIAYLLIVVFTGFVSCHLDEKIAFDMEFNSKATIPSIAYIDLPIEIPIPSVTTNIEKTLSSKNSKKEYLHTAKLRELVIKATDPADQSFGFLKDIEIYIDAEGLDKIKIAEKHDIDPDAGSTLDFDIVPDVDIAQYIKKDEFELKLKVTSRKVLLHKVKIDINTTVRVTADIF